MIQTGILRLIFRPWIVPTESVKRKRSTFIGSSPNPQWKRRLWKGRQSDSNSTRWSSNQVKLRHKKVVPFPRRNMKRSWFMVQLKFYNKSSKCSAMTALWILMPSSKRVSKNLLVWKKKLLNKLKNWQMLSISKLRLQTCYYFKIKIIVKSAKKYKLSSTTNSWNSTKPCQLLGILFLVVSAVKPPCLTTTGMKWRCKWITMRRRRAKTRLSNINLRKIAL